jgi:hypothetical protein
MLTNLRDLGIDVRLVANSPDAATTRMSTSPP